MDEINLLGKISNIRELVYIHIERDLRREGFDGILPPHGSIIVCLYQSESPVPIHVITEYTGKAKSTITSNLRTLEKFGYIQRVQNLDDNRSSLISLTEKGLSLKPVLRRIIDELMEDFYGQMEPADKEDLIRGITTIENNLKGVSK
ncbi:MAG: MarR family transcriptional regulator [Spirochaetales bacterium]|nr:MarR family transcriptional regulator [Spirochaetales bacterium]